MENIRSLLFILIVVVYLVTIPNVGTAQKNPDNVTKPWTYWWWMGSSVTRQGITQNLEDMHIAGIGGVHIIPIYGEKGDEENFVRYLSPEWMELLKYTVGEAKRLGMGVDMTTGTGWPFGGPDVTVDDAAKVFYVKSLPVNDITNIRDYRKPKSSSNLIALTAYDENGKYYNITSQVDSSGLIHWGKVQKNWKIYAAFQSPTLQKVKRSAPGGEGLVIDYFSETSIKNYMKRFENAFNQSGIKRGDIRSFYNDSYEVYGANWTSDFLSEFKSRRGYDLLPYLKYLADTATNEIRPRVVSDYCETISDLLYDKFTVNWVNKSHEMGMLTRNQAHGSPGNLLDLYALADIPETESFGASGFSIPGLRQDSGYEEDRFGRPNPLVMKFASSAADVTGKKLVSSESTTWLGDHFKVSLSQIKPQIDELFISGINHVFFHGTTYSPKEKAFPGRLFYASTNYGPSSHFWSELPALTGYIARCQEILQRSKPDNDILLYFPVHEVWRKQKSESIIRQFDVHKSSDWFQNSGFGKLAQKLWNEGYTFDYISDRIIAALNVEGGNLISGKVRYKVLVVPNIQHIPMETLTRLRDLAGKGAKIIFENEIPDDVPGLVDFERKKLLEADIKNDFLQLKGNVLVTSQVPESLFEEMIYAEKMSQQGLEFIRKQSGDTTFYFIANLSDKFSEGWVPLAIQAKTISIYDPLNNRQGNAAIRSGEQGSEVYLQILPGQSCILICNLNEIKTEDWEYLQANLLDKILLKGDWFLKPVQGAPAIPHPVLVQHPVSWTSFGGDYTTFSGKAVYSKSFEVHAELITAKAFLLDLGTVRETARVKINGKDLGLVWCLPNQVIIPEGIIQKKNTIELEVTNLSFNRIIDLDRRGGTWKNFYEINFVNIRYQPFDASNSKPEDSGLLSEISLVPMKRKTP